MPTIEYRCQGCNHLFRKLSFKGDKTPEGVCPECGVRSIKPEPTAEGLFGGISDFSSLAGDSN